MITKLKGDVTVGILLAEFLRFGYSVLLPIGENHRYDFVAEKAGVFTKVQCKTAKLHDGYIEFRSSSTNRIRGMWVNRHYRDDVDLFGVFCPQNNGVYFVPVGEVGRTAVRLRTDHSGKKRLRGTYEFLCIPSLREQPKDPG